jgi:hypothetical protein
MRSLVMVALLALVLCLCASVARATVDKVSLFVCVLGLRVFLSRACVDDCRARVVSARIRTTQV